MNILFSASTYPDITFPFSAFIGVICEEMTRQGHNVVVIAPQSLTGILIKRRKKMPIKASYNVELTGGNQSILVYRPLAFRLGHVLFERLSWKAEQIVFSRTVKKQKIEFDVIYAHFWNCAYNAMRVAQIYKKPLFVATGEDTIFAHKVIKKSELQELRSLVKGCICVSTYNMNVSIRVGLSEKRKCIVLPNAVNSNDFYLKNKMECREKLGFPKDAFIVAFCGRFIERKGIGKLSEAIKLLNNNKIKSIFIGNCIGEKAVIPDCDGILFTGLLNHKQIVDYLNSADVFVLPSLAEGCPNSTIEAMACGLPIISSNLPFNSDICTPNNSILVDPTDVKAIADAIHKVMKDCTLRRRMSHASLEIASQLNIKTRTSKIINFMLQQL